MDSLDSQQKTDTASAGLSGRQTHFGYLFVLGVLTLHPNRVSAESRWSWQNPVPRGNTLHGVAVLDPKTAIAVGYAETVLRTDDGTHRLRFPSRRLPRNILLGQGI